MVEVGEVDPGPEHPLAGVPGVVDHAAAEDADLDLGIEQDQVDGGLGGASVVSSSALRWRGLQSSSTAGAPLRA